MVEDIMLNLTVVSFLKELTEIKAAIALETFENDLFLKMKIIIKMRNSIK
jgi:hypothetical protein